MSAGLKVIRKRIGSVKNTQKITRAMKMVAAAKLRRASERIMEMRPFALRTAELLGAAAARAAEDPDLCGSHALLAPRERKKVLIFAFSSDRGLAGAFNSSVQKAAFQAWKEAEREAESVEFAVVGRKIKEFLKRRGAVIRHDFSGKFESDSAEDPGEVAQLLVSEYIAGEFDACSLVYNEFRSAIRQEIVSQQLLPIAFSELPQAELDKQMIFEPSPGAVLDTLGPMYVQTQVYRALLDSVASEHGARMSAMDAATSNASQIIDKLTLQFNRARQAAITKELMEIIGGAEALQ